MMMFLSTWILLLVPSLILVQSHELDGAHNVTLEEPALMLGNSSNEEGITLKEGEQTMYRFFIKYESSIKSINFESVSFDDLVHFEVTPNAVNVKKGLEDESLEVNQNGDLTGHVNISGLFVGFGRLKYVTMTKSNVIHIYEEPVRIIREKTKLEKAFVGSLIVLISIAYINMGCAIDLQVIKDNVKRPVAPGIGLACQYLFMPLCSFGLGYAMLGNRPEMWLALFLTGCSPGGGGSNVWTYLIGGSLDLSLTMTFISTLASYGAFPLWVLALGSYIPMYTQNVRLPYKKITILIISFILPIGIGMVIKKCSPKAAQFLTKMLKPLSLFFIAFVIIFGTYAYSFLFHFLTWQVLVAAILLPWLGFAFGGGVAVLFKRPWKDAVAICIETGVQNTGLAIGVLQVALADEAPLGDIGILVPVMVATMTPIPMLILYLFTWCHKRRKNQKQSLNENNTNLLAP